MKLRVLRCGKTAQLTVSREVLIATFAIRHSFGLSTIAEVLFELQLDQSSTYVDESAPDY